MRYESVHRLPEGSAWGSYALGRGPLEHREAMLVMHEIADRVDKEACQVGLGSARRDMGSSTGAGLGKGSQPVRQALWMEARFSAYAVLASCFGGL